MQELLVLFDKYTTALEQLSGLAQQKVLVARKNDLMALDDILRREQALALALRGLDQRREELLKQLGLQKVPLLQVYKEFPADMQDVAQQTAHRLYEQYQHYTKLAEIARDTLEINLHHIEKVLAEAGVEQGINAGYTPAEPEPPKPMKTDFHA